MTGLIIVAGALLAQSLFARAYGGTDVDEAHSIIQTADGGYAVSGYTWSYAGGVKSLLVMKLTPTGDVSWARVFTTDNPPDVDFGWSSIIQTADGGYAVITNYGKYTNGTDDALVLKLASDGSLQWARAYAGSSSNHDYGSKICQTSDGGYILYGATWGGGITTSWAYWLTKIDPSGTVLWSRVYDADQHDNGQGLTQTQDGGYMMTGYTRAYGANWDAFVLKVDGNGSLQWSNAYGGGSPDGDAYAIQTPDLGYLLWSNTASYASGPTDFMVVKTDPSGTVQWGKLIGGPGEEMVLCSPVRLQDGGFVFAGASSSFGSGEFDLLILKMDASGSLLWARTFGGADTEIVRSVIPTSDGGFALAGLTRSDGSGASDFLIIKADANGNYTGCLTDCSPVVRNMTVNVTPATSGTDCAPVATVINPTRTDVSPNLRDICVPLGVSDLDGSATLPEVVICSPVIHGLLFTMKEEMPVSIYSPDGRLTYSGQLRRGENRISLDPGVYFWQAGAYEGKAVVR
jgi:hypothetical protein